MQIEDKRKAKAKLQATCNSYVMLRITMYTQVHEEESSPPLGGFTAMLFGSMPLPYEDSVKVKMV